MSDSRIVDEIREILWPGGDKDHQWSSDEIEFIATVLNHNGRGPGKAGDVYPAAAKPAVDAEHIHRLRKLRNPVPTTKGRPLRYLCIDCGKNLKIANGIVIKEAVQP
jgi:hypothetical protein